MHATYSLAGGPFYIYFFRLLESETLVFLFLFLFLFLFFLEGGGVYSPKFCTGSFTYTASVGTQFDKHNAHATHRLASYLLQFDKHNVHATHRLVSYLLADNWLICKLH